MDAGKLKRRLRALLATAAPGSGTTPAERAAALGIADKMRAKHGIAALPVTIVVYGQRVP